MMKTHLLKTLVGTALTLAAFSAVKGQTAATAPAEEAQAAPKVLSFSLDYSLVSKYVWRGINLGNTYGTGKDKPSHQSTASFAVDGAALTGADIGTFKGSFWFEWYAGDTQEVDYTLAWSHAINGTPLTAEIGWIDYQFPQLNGDARSTQEVYASLAFDDSCIFGKPMLSPSITYYVDVDDVQASWIDIAVKHDFAMAEYGCDKTFLLKDMTITPSLTLGIDHRYYDKSGFGSENSVATRLGNMVYGLDSTLNLNGVFDLSDDYGVFTLTGFLRYSDALHDEGAVNDEFWGGFKIAYAW